MDEYLQAAILGAAAIPAGHPAAFRGSGYGEVLAPLLKGAAPSTPALFTAPGAFTGAEQQALIHAERVMQVIRQMSGPTPSPPVRPKRMKVKVRNKQGMLIDRYIDVE